MLFFHLQLTGSALCQWGRLRRTDTEGKNQHANICAHAGGLNLLQSTAGGGNSGAAAVAGLLDLLLAGRAV